MVSVKLDVEDRASVETAAKDIETGLGRLDILVNNAGYLEKAISIIDSDPDEWWKTWAVVSYDGRRSNLYDERPNAQ